MKSLLSFIVLGFTLVHSYAQKSDGNALFQDDKPLDIKLKVSIKDIKKKTNYSTYLPAVLYVKNEAGAWDSIKVDTRARGIFRRKNCYFPPIRVKVAKGGAKGTALEGNRSLKLVMPCQNNDGKNTLVLKEFICYKMYEQVSHYYFKTRRVNNQFTDFDGKKNKEYQLSGILIEDDDLVAKRFNAKVMENLNLHPLGLSDTSALQHDFFQLMVGNTDWSTTYLHNAKVIFQAPKKYIPLTYDFDMSGFVNPPYAEVNADLGITNVRERIYRGFCRKESTTQMVRKQFLDSQAAIVGVLDKYEKEFTPSEFNDTKKFLLGFFDMLKDNGSYQRMIGEGCRKK